MTTPTAKIRQPWALDLGARWEWGGQEEAGVAAPQTSVSATGKQVEGKVVEQPPAKTTEPWEISVGGPGWLANVSGFTGFHGVNPSVNVGFGQLLKHINLVFSSEAEVRKGRFGVLGRLLYLDGQAGVSGAGLVSRVGLGMQQFIGGLSGSYRIIEGPRGWLDLLAGFRFTYLGQQTGLNANEPAIDAASTNFVNLFAQQVTTPGSNVQTLYDDFRDESEHNFVYQLWLQGVQITSGLKILARIYRYLLPSLDAPASTVAQFLGAFAATAPFRRLVPSLLFA